MVYHTVNVCYHEFNAFCKSNKYHDVTTEGTLVAISDKFEGFIKVEVTSCKISFYNDENLSCWKYIQYLFLLLIILLTSIFVMENNK